MDDSPDQQPAAPAVESSGGPEFLNVALASFNSMFERQHRRAGLPRLPERDSPARAGEPDVTVIALDETQQAAGDAGDATPGGEPGGRTGWERLHRMFTAERFDNLNPWYRCLGLLKGLSAKTVVIERHYVCLDYRSEYASFYAHLDEKRPHSAVRLHFFKSVIAKDEVANLGSKKGDYLGYIVTRPGVLPLVGRAVLQYPSDYIAEAAAVSESVNFLGQHLSVMGVPFMQQDKSFAVCADVTLWGIHYSAFRRGLAERRVIADIVDLSGEMHPLRPRTSAGLTPEAAAEILGRLGMRSIVLRTPTTSSPEGATLPAVTLDELPGSLRTQFLEGFGALNPPVDPGAFGDQVSRNLEAALSRRVDEIWGTIQSDPTRPQVMQKLKWSDPAVRGIHLYLDYLLAPYLRSRLPVYLSTASHTFTLVGRTPTENGPVLYVHDDQSGPYLAMPSASGLSERELEWQSGRRQDRVGWEAETDPPVDRVRNYVASDPILDSGTPIEHVVIPTPPRVVLTSWEATAAAMKWVEALRDSFDADDLVQSWSEAAARSAHDGLVDEVALDSAQQRFATIEEEALLTFDIEGVRTSLIMGIDYKSLRRHDAVKSGDLVSANVFASMNLAEWLFVVEGVSQDNVSWEIVFDATSSSPMPRVQVVRSGPGGIVVLPGAERPWGTVAFGQDPYAPIKVPSGVGKIGRVVEDRE